MRRTIRCLGPAPLLARMNRCSRFSRQNSLSGRYLNKVGVHFRGVVGILRVLARRFPALCRLFKEWSQKAPGRSGQLENEPCKGWKFESEGIRTTMPGHGFRLLPS